MVIVAVRRVVPGFASTLKPTLPFPLPEAPDVMWNQLESEVAVHAHPAAAVTVALPDPMAAGIVLVIGNPTV
jgi:hypothetical protein